MTELLPYDRQDPHLLAAYGELDAWRTRLDYRGPLPRTWDARLRRDLEAEAVAASTRMEGVNVTVEEVYRILAGERPNRVDPEDAGSVEGYRDGMHFVLRQADDPAFTWDRGLVVALHDRVSAGRYPDAGRIRTEAPAYVVNRETSERVFLPPAGSDVRALLEDALGRVRDADEHPAITAGWIHVAIAAIHPFKDGNGRTARILASLALYRGGFKRPEFTSLEEWWGRHLTQYYSQFECLGDTFERGADVTPFLQGHVEAQLHQIRALNISLRAQQQVWTTVERVAHDAHLHERLANALWEAFFGRHVTAGYYRSLADVSPATGTNDLSAATAAGLLRPSGERRGRRYSAGDRLIEAVARYHGVMVDTADQARELILAELSLRISASEFEPAPPLDATP